MAAVRAQRELALAVYGATGFTGKFVAEHIARCQAQGKGPRLTWAIAGRSADKLQALLESLRAKGLPAPDSIIVADTNDPSSLDSMTSRVQLVMNCTGPYRFLGEQVVSSCVRCGVDYIDLCGEPEFMDKMLLAYHQQAKEKGVLVVHACAFDSVPADMGAVFTSKLFAPPAVISSIESFLAIDTGGKGVAGHFTTFEAAVHGFGGVKELQGLRREANRKFPLNDREWRIGPAPAARVGPFYDQRVGRYCFRFPGSDASVVRSSQRQMVLQQLVQAPTKLPRYSAFFTVPSRFWAAVVAATGLLFTSLAKNGWGRRMLLRHPSFFTLGAFTHKGPSDEQLAATSFTMTFYAKGYSGENLPSDVESAEQRPLVRPPPDKTLVARVSGPEPGYVATPLIFVEVARCLLEERASLPVQGGVYTPAAVFKDSTLIDRLRAVGVDFTVVEA